MLDATLLALEIHQFDRTVIIAVIAMRVVQVPIDQVVEVIPMGHEFMTTAGTMQVLVVVSTAAMIRCARVGIRIAHCNHVVFKLPIFLKVQLPTA